MKRAIPHKVKSVSSRLTDKNTEVSESSKPASAEVNRKACTSAAMIGLAISMGASSLLVPRQNDRAMAAEPVTAEPVVAASPATLEVPTSAAQPEVEVAVTGFSKPDTLFLEHVVQEGQTLWQIAQIYNVSADAIASDNNLPTGTLLHVGQVLRIPSTAAVGGAAQGAETVAIAPVPAPEITVSASSGANPVSLGAQGTKDLLKEKQEAALSRLKQKREELQASLSTLKPEVIPAAAKSVAQPEALPSPVEATQLALATPVLSAPAAITPPTQIEVPAPAAVTPQPEKAAKIGQTQVATVIPSLGVTQPEVLPAPQATSYRVNPGDTLAAIARDHGISQADLIAANRIQDPNLIFANQVLRIPQSVRSVEAVSSAPGSTLIASASQTPVLLPTVSSPAPASVEPLARRESQAEMAAAVSAVATPAVIQTVASTDKPVTDKPGTIKVATAPLGTLSLPTGELEGSPRLTSDTSANPYVNSLKTEIVKLRAKYQGNHKVETPIAATVPTTATPSLQGVTVPAPALHALSSRQVNPEFSAKRSPETLRAELQSKIAARKANSFTSTTQAVGGEAQPQLLAAAPLGSDSYAPIVRPLVGQMVSPDLPPLSAADRYLPNNASAFKGYIWPAKGVLTSNYGWRWGRMHKGIDIAAPIGTPVMAAAPGTVVFAGWNAGGYGNLVEIQHADGSFTRYAHNNRILVRNGQQVEQGQQIAEMGSTGFSTGPHSHFEVHLPGQGAVNPIAYLPQSRG